MYLPTTIFGSINGLKIKVTSPAYSSYAYPLAATRGNFMLKLQKNGTHAPHAEPVIAKTIKLSIIIPIYNEAGTLAELVRRVKAVDIEKELILVDDGSSDGTKEILNTWASDRPDNMKILFHTQNRGKGAAIATGLAEATGDIVIIQDADLEYDPNEYNDLLKPVVNGFADWACHMLLLSLHYCQEKAEIFYFNFIQLGHPLVVWSLLMRL